MSNVRHATCITGALGDIGYSVAQQFARDGASLSLCDLPTPSAAAPRLKSLEELSPLVYYEQADVVNAESIEHFVTESARRMGGVSVCVVNAGVVERGPLAELTAAAWRRTIDVNLTGAFLTAQAAARVMLRDSRGGHIVFISSWVQDVPKETIGAYCASKGGLKMLAKCLALELGPCGIRVNVVAPGWVDAGLTGENLRVRPALRSEIESKIPLGRLASADEVARTVRLLTSEDASYIHGATLLVDGGSSLGFRKAND